MSNYQRIIFGCLGSITPSLMNLLVIDIETTFKAITLMVLIGYVIRVLILCYIGGLIAYLYKDENSPIKIFQLGLAAPALITAFINAHNISYNPVNVKEPIKKSSIIMPLAYAEMSQNYNYKLKKFSIKETEMEQLLRGITGSVPKNIWFVIIGSHLKLEDAEQQVKDIIKNEKWKDFKPEIYEPYGDNQYYGVVIGANLTQKEAVELKKRAISLGLPKDTYLWDIDY